ncbi:MAG: hypothetical protein J6A59_01755, partial [Lachnospiraceae bacterium]|nr:hypothetical protein [Lachnospiraceae bacterium]
IVIKENDNTYRINNDKGKEACVNKELFFITETDDKRFVIDKIYNEDGTECKPPINPLLCKWDKLYLPRRYDRECNPILGYQPNGTPYMNYTCVLCTETKCRNSSCWEVPEEDKEEYNNYLKEYRRYMEEHNPSVYKLINERKAT